MIVCPNTCTKQTWIEPSETSSQNKFFLPQVVFVRYLVTAVKCLTDTQLEEYTGETLQAICIGEDFLNRTPKAQEIIARIYKWDCIT
jgi:hypothetical protein